MYRDPRSRGICGWGSPATIEKIAKVRFCGAMGGKFTGVWTPFWACFVGIVDDNLLDPS